MKSSEMRALVEKYIDAYNRMDVAAMLLVVHPDVEFRNISGGSVNASAKGIAELRALAEQSLPLFSERHQDVLSFNSTETQAVASIGFRAVIAHDLPNGLKKGQVLKLTGRSEFEFCNGAISKITDIS
ncbi:MAG: nuclear transport factor 2 family protein [Gammaproteobacteria bacterium]|nr:nuclear transport factor 2 family protein [Gammaproteobacteria bacterium]MBU1414004.1 nuclear transport factor 2 family protein [Gammaproteobacteria bacterium]